MKHLSYITAFAILLIISCGDSEKSVEELVNNGSQSELKQKREELNNKMRALKSDLTTLDNKLAEFEADYNYALVEAMQLEPQTFKHYVKVQGEASTDENILVYPEFSGNLVQIYVKEGDEVRAGQKLAKIDDGGLSSQLDEMQAKEELAKTRFERQQRLWDQNIGSEIQYLEAKSSFDQINNAVKQMKKQLKKSVIYAPFDGKIDEVITDQGQVVSPGQTPIFRLLNLTRMYVTANVPETYVGSIELGTEAVVSFGSINKEFVSEVTRVSNTISESNRNFRVRVAIPDSIKYVKPNLIATVKLNDYTTEEAVIIPENILRENAEGESFTFSLNMENDSIGSANLRELKLGKHYEGDVEVLKGLQATDIVVTEGARSVKRGEKVKVLNFISK